MQHDEVKRCLELAEYRLDIAREDLQVAIENMSANHLRAANNRAYYSIYHAITAVLALEQTAFKRHKDTLAYFNKKYIKDDIFPRTLGRQISRAEEVRHASDYDEFYIVAKEERAEVLFKPIQIAPDKTAKEVFKKLNERLSKI